MKKAVIVLKNHGAVDLTLYTKEEAVNQLIRNSYNGPKNFGYIGDELIDIPVIENHKLGLVGCPSNAQREVIKTVRNVKGLQTSSSFTQGFIEFYEHAKELGIKEIVSDRDGVVLNKGILEEPEEFYKIVRNAGNESPMLRILTGSSYIQNLVLIEDEDLKQALSDNDNYRMQSHFILAENGMLHINPVNGLVSNFAEELDRELVRTITGRVKDGIISGIEKQLLSKYGLELSDDYNDQTMKIYIPEKETMLTFNIPRYFSDGETEYRTSSEADSLRDDLVNIIQTELKKERIRFN